MQENVEIVIRFQLSVYGRKSASIGYVSEKQKLALKAAHKV